MKFSWHAVKPAFICVCLAAALYGCGKGASDNKAAKAPQPATAGAAVMTQGDPGAGRQIYTKYCHYCHGARGFGDGPVGIAITPHPADFVHDTKRMSKTDEELYKSISQGVRREVGGEEMAMPRWQEVLTGKERWDVLAYVRQLEREGKKEEEKSGGR